MGILLGFDMSTKRTIEIETLKGGAQPKPYADHLYEYRVTIKTINSLGAEGTPADSWAEKIAINNVANNMIHKENRKADTLDSYAQSYIDEVTVEAPGVVFVRTLTPYID